MKRALRPTPRNKAAPINANTMGFLSSAKAPWKRARSSLRSTGSPSDPRVRNDLHTNMAIIKAIPAYMKNTCLQIRAPIPSSAPATIGPRMLPMLEPKSCMEMAKPRRSGKRWDRAAAEGRCHKDPGMGISKNATTRNPKEGEAPTARRRADSHCGPCGHRRWSTSKAVGTR